ncbi:hypothetical protein [Paenimyroides aestuarii]|uniref:Lipocalin-like domain-containing protein n=1 Tax=Paenimyroides aestuarii TaxID=2968490 RepID=A0ABY5NV48_9FLAO|nr:hypothetical protein [Paenimyroides aestuarii]UUV22462.1 hypothetical protein NPX36_05325 [Paenimyroides aestuarii]
MKKLLFLFILSIAISRCSEDDNTAKTTALEGKWYLSYVSAISKIKSINSLPLNLDEKTIYQFTNNIYVTSSNQFVEKGIFTYKRTNDSTIVELIPDNPDYLKSTYSLKFSNNNSIVEFISQNEPSIYFELTRIQ